MKKHLLFLMLLITAASHLNAQVTVYSENFTSGVGGWTLNVSTGTNGTNANAWEVNDTEGGVLPPGCGVASNGNPTLHITCTSLFCGSLITGAVYNAGITTNKRAESPSINTTGYSNLTLSFNAISLGDAMLDNASVYYNDGSGWQLLTASIKSPICGGGQGQWTNFTASLPASCNNISNLKIGFNWTNNNDNIGTDPSIAIDNIVITAPNPLSASISSQINASCFGLCDGSVTISASGGTSPYSFSWSPAVSTTSSASGLCAGIYTCTVTDAAAGSVDVLVTITEPAEILSSQSLTICDGESVSVGSSTYTVSGVYTDVLSAVNGCDSTVTTTLTVNDNTSSTITATACATYTLNSQTYSASGTYTQTLTNTLGCDSTITLNLTIDDAPDVSTTLTNFTISAVELTATNYQWLDCDNGFTEIAGENNQDFNATSDGNYAVEITNGTCVDTSACVTIFGVGVNELNSASEWSIYPNPFHTQVVILFNNPEQTGSVQILNTNGEIVLLESINSGENTLDLSHLTKGVYFIQLITSEEVLVSRIIKN